MKNLCDCINENKNLSDMDKIFVEYWIKGLQKEKNKTKAIEDLSAMLPTKHAFGSTKTCKDVIMQWLNAYADEVPETFGDESDEAIYNYLMAVTDKDIENSYK